MPTPISTAGLLIAQERRLASYFAAIAGKVGKLYPFTASALHTLSKEYSEDSHEEDNRAALDEMRD